MIDLLIDGLRGSASQSGIVLRSGATGISRSELRKQVQLLAHKLRRSGFQTVALIADNGLDWVITDLACQLATVCIVPIPLFFTPRQRKHVIFSSGVEALISERPVIDINIGPGSPLLNERPHYSHAKIYPLQHPKPAQLPAGTQKITFTSGTTGTPKGVCLSSEQQLLVAKALVSAIHLDKPTHLCVLPLSTLLENLAGIYAPLLAGGTVISPSLDELGMTGSSGLVVRKLLDCIDRCQPDSLILVPEILGRLTAATAAGWSPPDSLKFVAVGGGKVAPKELREARLAGIPAYEGYGLSECASVVSLNVSAADRVGSVGRPLPHIKLAVRNDEIVVSGNVFLGYANQPDSWHLPAVPTGDLGHIDAQGFIHIDGRAKHQLISSFGRNVAPEWVESELMACHLLQQAIVFGDARPFCIALLLPTDSSTSDQDIAACVERVNQSLPDYARVLGWHRLTANLNCYEDLMTGNGRPRRENIERAYSAVIDDLYESNNRACGQ